MSRARAVAAHAVAVAWLLASALWLILPLVTRLDTHVPGYFPGDNVAFLWNTWWFRESILRAHSSGFWCDRLFAPWGTSLVLHTHTFLEAALGVLLFPGASPVVAHNLLLVGGIAANGLCAYLLAFHYSRRSMPSLVAGTMFGWNTFVTLHLAGHFNLVHAWVVPLAAWAAARMLDRPSTARTIVTACVMAAVTYSDYYLLVYALGLVAVIAVGRTWRLDIASRQPLPRRVMVFAGGAALAIALVLTILWTGGWTVSLGPRVLSMRGTRNLTAAALLLALAAGLSAHRIRLRSHRAQPASVKPWLLGIATYGVLVAPLAFAAVQLIAGGGYVEQHLHWRSSPPGIDLATLVEGPPRHLLFGEAVTAAYKTAEIDPIEQSGWLGLVAACAAIVALLRYRRDAAVREWLIVAGVFMIIALGPFLRVGGVDTGIPLPFALMRYVPVLSNARMPGRAIVVVHLACAVLTALVLARRTKTWRECVVWMLVVFAEAVPRPSPLYALPPADLVDRALVDAQQRGAVLELPAGLRDGFGIVGGVDHRMLVHQFTHGRPLVGGFVARLSPGLRDRNLRTPFLAAVFAMSDSEHPRSEPIEANEAAELGIAFLVVNRDALESLDALRRSSLEAAGFRFVLADGDRELYTVTRTSPRSQISSSSR